MGMHPKNIARENSFNACVHCKEINDLFFFFSGKDSVHSGERTKDLAKFRISQRWDYFYVDMRPIFSMTSAVI